MKTVSYLLLLLFLWLPDTRLYADTLTVVKEHRQQSFPADVPAGNYSGITRIGQDEYAVVSDKSPEDGFYVFQIEIDSVTGRITQVTNRGFRSAGAANRDGEGIAYLPATNTLFISGEADGKILEYELSGQRTQRELSVPAIFNSARGNLGLEALTYSAETNRLWTCNESTLSCDGKSASATDSIENVVRLQSFDAVSLQPLEQYAYRMDRPTAGKKAKMYALGVPALAALPDSSLLVLEREFYVPKKKLGAFVRCKLYQIWPKESGVSPSEPLHSDTLCLSKHLITEWRTRLTLSNHAIANYEGMCFGPRLADGTRVLILVSDSQNQYAGVLKDWFKTIVLRQQ